MGLHVVQRHGDPAVVHDAEHTLPGPLKAPSQPRGDTRGPPGIFRSLAASGVMLNDVGQ